MDNTIANERHTTSPRYAALTFSVSMRSHDTNADPFAVLRASSEGRRYTYAPEPQKLGAQSWFVTLRLFFGCQAHKPGSSRTTPRYQSKKARPRLRPGLFVLPSAYRLPRRAGTRKGRSLPIPTCRDSQKKRSLPYSPALRVGRVGL